MTGKVILLNGASSAGKSSIARAVQARIDAPFWHYSIDHIARDAGILPMDRIRRGDFVWAELRPAFFDGFHRSLPALVGTGNNLIVEIIFETRDWLRDVVGLLAPFDVFFVGVHCDLEELERREKARGDRRLGDARRDFETAHRHAIYDLQLDGGQPPELNADRLIEAWNARTRPSAFETLRERLG
jgi:chloramphenicol 3-O phosphotransferase